MPDNKHFPKPKQGEPIYLAFRYGKVVLTTSEIPRVFYNPEHFEHYKKRYNHHFLSTDQLVKYVPEDVKGFDILNEFVKFLIQKKGGFGFLHTDEIAGYLEMFTDMQGDLK